MAATTTLISMESYPKAIRRRRAPAGGRPTLLLWPRQKPQGEGTVPAGPGRLVPPPKGRAGTPCDTSRPGLPATPRETDGIFSSSVVT